MTRRDRILGLLLVLVAISAVKLGGQLYRWYTFAEERAVLVGLQETLEETGLEVVRTQLRADSLRVEIEALDRELEAARRGVAAYDRFSVRGELPSYLYGAYRSELDAYNAAVGRRNARFEVWREVVSRNHEVVDRFNTLADRMRSIADRMGEPYFPIPTPVEVAVERGVLGSS